MTQSENKNDHFDLDHFDHILATPFFLPCSSYVTLILLLFGMGVIWDLHGNCLGLATKAFLIVKYHCQPCLRFRSVPPPFQVRCKSVPKNWRKMGGGWEEHRRYVHTKSLIYV